VERMGEGTRAVEGDRGRKARLARFLPPDRVFTA
jgi:hypothetical protein